MNPNPADVCCEMLPKDPDAVAFESDVEPSGYGRVCLRRLSRIGLGRHAADVGVLTAAGCCVGWSAKPKLLHNNADGWLVV